MAQKLYGIFDMDGTLVDTWNFHKEAWISICKKYGPYRDAKEIGRIYDSDDSVGALAGKKKIEKLISMGLLCQQEKLPELDMVVDLKEKKVDKLIYEGAKEIPGASSFLKGLKKYGAITALATSARKEPGLKLLDKLNMKDYFDAFVFREDVANPSKPNPEYYFKAAGLIDADPEYTFAFEDSKPGFESVVEAQFKLIAVTKNKELARRYNPVLIIPDFTNLKVEQLESLIKAP